MVLSTVAQVPVLARAKFNHGQLQCEFVQTVVINDVYTHIFSQSCLQKHCMPTRLSSHWCTYLTSTKSMKSWADLKG